MSAEEIHEKSLGLHCGRRTGAQQSEGRKPFALPGDEAKWPRDRTVDIKHIKLELDVDLDSRPSAVQPRIPSPRSTTASPPWSWDAAELEISAVTLSDGTPLSYAHEDWKLSIDLGGSRNAGEEVTVRIEYGTTPRKGLYFNMPTTDTRTGPGRCGPRGRTRTPGSGSPASTIPTRGSPAKS